MAEVTETLESTSAELSDLRQLVSDLRSQNTQLTADYEARLLAERLEVEKSVREECSQKESAVADDIAAKYEDEILRMRQEHEAGLDEVKRDHEQLEEEKRELEVVLESERTKVSQMEKELEKVRVECEVLTRDDELAKTLASHISDMCQLITNPDPTRSEAVTSDLTQSEAVTSESVKHVDWGVVRLRFDELIRHLQWSLSDSEKCRLELIAEHSRQLDTLCRNHDSEVSETRHEGEKKVEDLTVRFEADMGEIRREWQTEVDELRAANQALVEELGEKHAAEVEELKQRFAQEIVDVQNHCEYEMERLRGANVEELRLVKETCQSEMEDLKEKSRCKLEEVRQQQQDELTQLREQLTRDFDEVRQQHSSDVSELTRKHQDEVDELKMTHAAEVEELRSKWQAEVTEVREQGQTDVTEDKDRLKELKKSRELDTEELERRCVAELEERSPCGDMEDVHGTCRKTIEDLRASVDGMKSNYERKILELTARLSDQAPGSDEMQLSLLLEDYLPVQRHEEIVDQLKTALRTVSPPLCLSVCLSFYLSVDLLVCSKFRCWVCH